MGTGKSFQRQAGGRPEKGKGKPIGGSSVRMGRDTKTQERSPRRARAKLLSGDAWKKAKLPATGSVRMGIKGTKQAAGSTYEEKGLLWTTTANG